MKHRFILLNQTPSGSQCSSAMFPRKKKFKVMPTTVNIMATVLKDEGGVLILNFLPPGIITKLNSVALVRERTIPTERPLPVGEVSANFCG